MFRSVVRQPMGVASLVILIAVGLLGVFGPLLAPYDPLAQDTSTLLAGPSAQHLLGTDDLGRDVLSRLLAGSPLSLLAAVEAVAVGLVLGVVPGLLSVLLRPGRLLGARHRRSRAVVPPSELRPLFPPPGATLREIGRASCRERVLPTV